MNHRIAIGRLWWKELRQLLPLVTMLIGVALFLHGIFLLPHNDAQQSGQLGILLGLPGLFAVGAGALLIGQEKELRTLNWLSSLPVPHRDIIRTKLGVSLLALAAMWCISFLLYVLVNSGDLNGLRQGLLQQSVSGALALDTPYIFWPLHTLFLLLAGVALAWRFQSPFIALLALLPMAILPLVVARVLTMIFTQDVTPSNDLLQTRLLAISQIVGCGALLWWGRKNALRALGPQVSKVRAVRGQTGALRSAILGTPQAPFPALLWQAFHQNKTVLLGCLGMLLAAAMLGSLVATEVLSPGWVVLGVLLGFLAVSWLGVSALQSDRLHQRIRFLADRGVSPTAAWLSRQLIPASVALSCSIVGALAFSLVFQPASQSSMIWLATGALFLITLLVYITSQWVGQIFSSPIVSAIAGPAISVGTAAYASFAIGNLGAPLWLVFLSSLFPLLATALLMQRWMDGQFDRVYWGGHALTLIAYLLLPSIPLLVTLATYPTMSSQAQQELDAAANEWANFRTAAPTQELVLITDGEKRERELGAEDHADNTPPASFAEQARRTANDLRNQLSSSTSPVRSTFRVQDFLSSQWQLTRARLADDSSNTSQADLQAHYLQVLDLAVQIVGRLRVSPRILEQDMADQLEIAMLDELNGAQSLDWIAGSPVYDDAVRLLADGATRNTARRRAVALSWKRFMTPLEENQIRNEIGGHSISHPVSSNFVTLTKHRRNTGRWVAVLWQYASNTTGNTQELRKQLANLQQFPPEIYGVGPQGKYHRADGLEFYLQEHRVVPGSQWHANWERQAAELSQ
ncbi:ABC transporter permease [Aureliella helgolandensis]|uniref:ABC-2 family transporter protein n=1 Tax=Aureliella helgolandensis TaxID=2527968 RepID=A0A518GFW2_9BACT|nr:ABC transporter permease [Aureliella helgolandensis]QDV27485.1 ABC-2 family transporter protein [Aureliella helgolandensis]